VPRAPGPGRPRAGGRGRPHAGARTAARRGQDGRAEGAARRGAGAATLRCAGASHAVGGPGPPRCGAPGRAAAPDRAQECARRGEEGGDACREEGKGEEEEERERGGRGAHLGDPKSGGNRHRITKGTRWERGGRKGEGEEVATREKSNERDREGGRAHGGGGGVPGARGPGPSWARPGWVASRAENPQHARPVNPKAKRNPKRGETDARSNTIIRQKKYAST
jgi:hypothetical protein